MLPFHPLPTSSLKDDESFPSYIARMKKDACWAGNLELVAASNMLSANIHVHQSGQPRWVVGCALRVDVPLCSHIFTLSP